MSFLSIPNPSCSNPLPVGFDTESMAALVARVSLLKAPRIPTGIGTCLLVTREVLDRIGGLDPDFSPGYWEEFDFCRRAQLAGFEIRCADDAFIFHEGSTSFQGHKALDAIRKRNFELLERKWPGFHTSVDEYISRSPMRELQERVRTGVRKIQHPEHQAVLHVVASFSDPGGVQEWVRSVTRGTADRYHSTVISCVSNSAAWVARDLLSEELTPFLRHIQIPVGWWEINGRIEGSPAETQLLRVEELFEVLLESSDFRLVHIHHMERWPTLRLAELARARKIPVVFSVHDYFPFCPSPKLINSQGQRCTRVAAHSQSEACQECTASKWTGFGARAKEEIRDFLERREAGFRRIFDSSDTILVNSPLLRERVQQVFGAQTGGRCEIVEPVASYFSQPVYAQFEGPLELAYVGSVLTAKGWNLFRLLAQNLLGPRFRFRVVGQISDFQRSEALAAGIAVEGSYQTHQLPEKLAGVHAAIFPFQWEETYGIAVEEVRALGIIPIVSNLGSPQSRIQPGVNGYVFGWDDFEALQKIVLELESNRSIWRVMRSRFESTPRESSSSLVQRMRVLYGALAPAESNV